jgi:hypothetical protein
MADMSDHHHGLNHGRNKNFQSLWEYCRPDLLPSSSVPGGLAAGAAEVGDKTAPAPPIALLPMS